MEWIEANAGWLWFVATAALIGVELLTLDLVFAMLAVGAAAAGGAALVGAGLPMQLLAFVVSSVLMLATVRPTALRRLHPDPSASASYLDTLPGRSTVPAVPVTSSEGLVTVDGDTWSARVEPGAPALAAGENAVIVRVDGARLILAPAEPTGRPRPLGPA
ncbi:NfeD family protein [Micrococcus sp.]|uniref:NfeD family protein n=1 Tax=Micrococcus sp. TaxID=1271 RepID=UPI002A9104F1|nr:NfeD family protein [Micrococcus sp.]MDY6055414.1 NfeD family protein [Micrococcus sp.]